MSIDRTAAATFLTTLTTEAAISARVPEAMWSCPIEDQADLLMLNVRTQPEVTALAVNLTGGTVTSEQLTELLCEAFPHKSIGDRHGKHYLSLARTGKLKGIDAGITIPKATRKVRAAKMPGTVVDTDAAIAQLTAQIEALQAHKATLTEA